MNKKLSFIILIVILVGVVAFLTLSKKQSSPDQAQTNFQNEQRSVSNNSTTTSSLTNDTKNPTNIARSYLQQNDQQIYLFSTQKDGTVALKTGVPTTPQDKSIEDLRINWKWFTDNEPVRIIDAWQPPFPPGVDAENYHPDSRYTVQWMYGKYMVIVKINKDLVPQSTEISPFLSNPS